MKFAFPVFIKNLDMFGAPLPNFNSQGRATVKTSCGTCVSLLILTVTFMFAILKLEHLVEKKNPSITTNSTPLAAGERFNTGDEDFMMAFAAVGQYDRQSKSDPRYV